MEKAMTAVVLLVLLIYFSWQLTLVSVFILFLLGSVNFIVSSRVKTLGRQFYDTSRKSYQSLVEVLSEIRPIKSFNRQQREDVRLAQVFNERETALFHYRLYHDTLGPLNDLLAVFSLVAIVYLGGGLVIGDDPSLSASLMTYIVILIRLLPELSELYRIRTSILHGWASVSALLGFIEQHQHKDSGTVIRLQLTDFTTDSLLRKYPILFLTVQKPLSRTSNFFFPKGDGRPGGRVWFRKIHHWRPLGWLLPTWH